MVLLLNGYRYKATESASRLTRKGFFDLLDYLDNFLHFEENLNVWSLQNQPTVHSGGVIRKRVCGSGCWP